MFCCNVRNLKLFFCIFFHCSTYGKTLLVPPTEFGISEMAKVILHFNKEYFQKETSTLALITSSEGSAAKYYFDDLIYEIVEPLNELKLSIASQASIEEFQYFNIVMIDSYEAFRRINPGIKTQHQDYSEFYLIVLYCKKESHWEELQKIFDYCWSFYIINVNVLIETSRDNVELYTYSPFSKTHCNSAVIMPINGGSITHYRSFELFPKKIKNIYNCTLITALWNVPPYLVLTKTGKGNYKFNGMEGYLLNILSDVMNFRIGVIVPPNNEQRGLVMANGTVTGAIKLLQEKKADLSLGCFRCTLERSTTLSPSITFHQTMQVFTVFAATQPFTTYEVITYPFDYYIWIILLGVLIIFPAISLLLLLTKTQIFQFVYGFSKYESLIMNIPAIILGHASKPEPKYNFARYLLTMWLLLTLVLRSSYQGALYDLLNNQKSIGPPDTAQELSQRGYKLILNVATNDSFSSLPVLRNKLIEVLVLNITDAGGFPILEANKTQRYVTGTPYDFLVDYVKTNDKYGVFHTLKESIFAQQICIYYTKHSFLTDQINEILMNLQSFGLINYWASKYFDATFVEATGSANKEPHIQIPLTMLQLYAVFEIHFYISIMATIIFIGEILWGKIIGLRLGKFEFSKMA